MTAHFVQFLDDLKRRSLRMASGIEDMLRDACDAVLNGDATLARATIERDDAVDLEEVEVEGEVIRLLALYSPVGCDLRLLCSILKINNDLERVADCAVNVAERAQYLSTVSTTLLPPEIREMCAVSQRLFRRAVQVYGNENTEAAEWVRKNDQDVDELYAAIIKGIIADQSDHPEKLEYLFDMISVAKNLERIADHATNIAEEVIFLSTGRIVRHQPSRLIRPT